jgi:tetratricopeptide (TPR) repeat protein
LPQLSLQSPARRLLALAAGLALLGAAAAGIVRGYQASRARAEWMQESLERAVRLEPDNAQGWHLLGRWEELALGEGNLERAREHYRRAAELNPYESRYWLDLANLLALTGASQEAEACVAQALRVDPNTPDTLWSAGNFWLRTAEPQRAFPYLRSALEAEPALAPALIQTAHSAVRDPEVLLREVLPPRPRFLIAYLRLLVRQQDAAASARVWRALVELGENFEGKEVLFYVNYLIDAGDADGAMRAWDDLKRLRQVAEAGEAGGLLYNPDLRREILNGGFDWRVVERPGVSVTLGEGRRGGSAALVLRFSGEDNLHFHHFFQVVPVEPNRRYRFEAWMSSENITTESGPRLEVYDPAAGAGTQSAGLIGSNGWQPLRVEFTAGPRSRLVRVGIVRLPSQRVESRIRGVVRAAEFSLRPAESR